MPAWWPNQVQWSHVLLTVEWVLRLVLSGVVVLRRRPVPVTLAWIVLLMFLPVVGAVVYVLVGENRLGRKRLAEYETVTRELEPVVVARWWERGLTARREGDVDEAFEAVANSAMAMGGLPPLKGNRLELLGDTDEVLRRLVRDIDESRAHCHLLFYIWQEGGKAEDVAGALIRARARGVECRVLVDSVGSLEFVRGEMFERMRSAGVDVREALPASPPRVLVARLDLRNHRKIAVIDGRVAYTGSQNLTDTTFHYKKRKQVGPWIDASVRMEGPAVQAMQLVFLRDWAMELDEEVRLEDRFFVDPDEAGRAGGSGDGLIVQVVPTGPGPDVAALRESLLMGIYASREELVMTTPYFVPDEATLAALTAAARRGVDVRMVVPRINDNPLVALASRSHFDELLRAGVKIHQFQGGLLHAKTMTVDGRFAMIGSANIDMRSFWLNFEVTLMVYGASFARELETLQEIYLSDALELDREAWGRRGFGARAAESVARLFGPLL